MSGAGGQHPGAGRLYELHAEAAPPEWRAFRDAYETGLAQFEAGEWAAVCQTLQPLLAAAHGQYDLASLEVVGRAVAYLKTPLTAFDPVIDLSTK